MPLLKPFNEFIKTKQLFTPSTPLLLAVSGGVDSVVLTELCRQSGFMFSIAHCNFRLRGAESERDEAFVTELAARLQVQLFLKKFDTESHAKEAGLSIEEAARNLRYNWFAELAAAAGKDTLIVTAHHADDTIETLLMNFFRGTGIRGLHGIPVKQGRIVRPLLFARREEIEAFAAAEQLAYVTDSSNAANEFTRNFFRNRLIPELVRVYPSVKDNLLRNVERFAEAEELYTQSVNLHRKKLVEIKGNEFHIPVLKLQKTRPLLTILHELLRDFGFTSHQTPEVAALLESETGRYVCSSTHRVLRNRKWLIISPLQSAEESIILIEEGAAPIRFQAGMLSVEQADAGKDMQEKLSASPALAQLDAAGIRFPLILRKWKAGDYFYPLGMGKKKKISRFLTDEKLSLNEKQNTWVLESDRRIIWVIGRRIDDRFKISSKTKRIIKLRLSVTK